LNQQGPLIISTKARNNQEVVTEAQPKQWHINSVLIVDDNYDSDTYGHKQKLLLWKNEIKIVGPISKSLFVMSKSSQLPWESLSSMLAFTGPTHRPSFAFEFLCMEITPLHRIVHVGPTF